MTLKFLVCSLIIIIIVIIIIIIIKTMIINIYIALSRLIHHSPLQYLLHDQNVQIKRECPLRPIGTWRMSKNRISSYFVHS